MSSYPNLITNRYFLLRPLGQGGMGVVYLAKDRLTGRSIALKRITIPEQALQFTSMNPEEDNRLALAREFQMLASLRHPHIISVLDFGFDESARPYFTMDFLPEGQPLVAYGRKRPFVEQIELLMQLLQVLAYLYRRDIIHRDLKPDNVLVVDNHVMVLDFGLAVSRSFAVNTADDTIGTVAYMAPELLAGAPASTASDLYAVGVIAYELLAGHHPFDTRSLNALLFAVHNHQPDLASLPDNPQLRGLMGRLLAKEPADRINRVADVMRLLAEALGASPPVESVSIRDSYLQAATFVGRKAERRQLMAALAQVMRGEGSAWLLAGESGVGKSRLLEELRVQAIVAGVRVLTGQAVEGGGRPFELWRDLLRHLLLIVEPDDLAAGVLKAIVPDVGELLGRDVPDAPALRGNTEKQRLTAVIVSLFQQLKRPLVLLLEDLHWSGTSLEPLRALVHQAPNLPLLILGSYRDDETADLPQSLPGIQTLKLPRLNEEEVTELSRAILGNVGQQQPIVSLLQRETEGNAFFVVEVLRSLAEEAGRLDDIGHMVLPQRVMVGGIEQVVQRRLQRLPVQARPLLQLAAVAGRQIDLPVMRQLASDREIDLDAWLITAANAAILETKDNQWRFSHDKLRQGALAQLSAAQRAVMHKQVASAIETTYPDDDGQAISLVEHFHRAGDVVGERRYAVAAMEQIVLRSSLFERAFAIGERVLAGLPDDPILELRVRQLLAQGYERAGNHNASHVHYQVCAQLAESLPDQAALAATLNGMSVISSRMLDFDPAESLAGRALAVAEASNDLAGMAQSLHSLGMAAHGRGDYDRAEAYYQRSQTIRKRIDDQAGRAALWVNLCDIWAKQGRLVEARKAGERGQKMFEALGDIHGEYHALLNLGAVAAREHDNAAAEAYYQQSLQLMGLQSERPGLAYPLARLGEIMVRQGRPDEAETYARQALAVCLNSTNAYGIVHARKLMAEVWLWREEEQQARVELAAGWQLAQQTGSRPQLLELMVLWAIYFERIGILEHSVRLAGFLNTQPGLDVAVKEQYLLPLNERLSTIDIATLYPTNEILTLERATALILDYS